MLIASGLSPLVARTRLSEETNVPPDAESDAPPVADELSQPRLGPLAGFAQGQPITPAAPGSQTLVNAVPPNRSRTNTSSKPFVSPGTRSVASLDIAT